MLAFNTKIFLAMKKALLFLPVLIFVISACQKDDNILTPGSDEALEFRTAELPFKVNMDFVFTLGTDDVTCEMPKARLGFFGEGNASHMGKIEGQFNHCINPFAGDNLTDGAGAIIAANGDEVHVAYEGTITRSGGQSFVEGTFTISGGTGRFDGASGSGILTAVQELVPPTYPGFASFEGVIVY